MPHQRDAHPLVYLDHAGTTPVRAEVRAAMEPYLWGSEFGNPSSAHRLGQRARAALEDARRRIAAALGCPSPGEVLFTSGGTESDNLAVLGTALAARAAGAPFRVAVSAIEHKAVLDAGRAVERFGGECVILPVDGAGLALPEAVEAALKRGPAVLSMMWVNNEVGVVQDVAAVARQAADFGVPLHVDAVQAVGKVPCALPDHPSAMLTISGHKIGAPKGIGALLVRRRELLQPLLHGGGQEFGVRPGTENVAGAAGLAAAVELAVAEADENAEVTGRLRDELERRLLAAVPDAQVHAAAATRAPHICHVSIPGTRSAGMLMHLDLAGIACSSGAACLTGAAEPSHVLRAMGVSDDLAAGALRFSFSPANTLDDVERAAAALPAIVAQVRHVTGALGPT